jgi:sugar/nucleoside kinase (ribokinase family)
VLLQGHPAAPYPRGPEPPYHAGPVLLILGDSNADAAARVPRFPHEGEDVPVGDLRWSSGGAGVNVATAFARLGGAARLVSRVGGDASADVALAAARRAGVDLSAVQRDPGGVTGACFVVVTKSAERTFFSHRGANAALALPAPAVWEGVRRVHVCGHALLGGAQRETTLAMIAEAGARDLPCSIDLCLPWIESAGPAVLDLFPSFEVVFTNEAELCRLMFGRRVPEPPSADVEDAGRRARERGAAMLVVKRGAAGAMIVTDGIEHVAPFPVEAVDSTAAGDAFVAGFLWAVEQGASPKAAARLACAAGAMKAARAGSAEAVPTREELARFLGARGALDEVALPLLALLSGQTMTPPWKARLDALKLRDLAEIFGTPSPVIGMVHCWPLPGAPGYVGNGIDTIVEHAIRTTRARSPSAGADGIIVENMWDIPFRAGPTSRRRASPRTPSSRAR